MMTHGQRQLWALAFLFLLAAPTTWASEQGPSRGSRRLSGSQENDRSGQNSDNDQQQPPAKPFKEGYEYSFTYNGQIAQGFNQDPSASGNPPQQKSVARIQAQAKITFHSDRHAQLKLEKIRIGHLNDRIQNAEQVQPMGMFQQQQVPEKNMQKLQMPVQFSYVDGVVGRVDFETEDVDWAKNIKRSVLNLLQLNLKRNNAQGGRGVEDVNAGPQQDKQQDGFQNQRNSQQQDDQMAFTTAETTIEGDCQTTYIVNKAQQEQQQGSGEPSSQEQYEQAQLSGCKNCFNVTKSINFKQCKKIADVAYGYQTQQQQPQCMQCQEHWAKQLAEIQQPSGPQGQQQRQAPHPCDQCDPKEIKEQKLDRTTVFRFVLQGKPSAAYGIRRAELVSQYTYKNLRSETGQYGAAMQAVVAAELIFRGAQQKNTQMPHNQQIKRAEHQLSQETLLYSNGWDVNVKRFYMYGDGEMSGSSPFVAVTQKVEKVLSLVQKLVQAAQNKVNGIELFEATIVQDLIELLRKCSQSELKQIQQKLIGEPNQQSQQNGSDNKSKANAEILADLLAAAGTRNTIEALSQIIHSQQMTPARAAQALKGLSGLPAPSEAQVDIVMKLCQNSLVDRSMPLKQACWLTFGWMVGELCLHQTQKSAQQSPFGAQSGFSKEEQCPGHKKEMYKQALVNQYQEAQTTYEQILALKALGNAGLDVAINKLESIIESPQEQRICRIQAIDALRRQRTAMPRKIQRVLLPVFLNTQQHPEIRIAAFSLLMKTQPEQPVVDQIAYTLSKERSPQVQAFVYTTMKSMAQSPLPVQQQLAKHLKNALKLANVDEQQLESSRKYQLPVYSQEEKEGVILNIASVFGSRSMLPTHLSASLDSMLNDEYNVNAIKIGMSQKNMEQWYEKIVRALQMMVNNQQSEQQMPTRAQRSVSPNQGEKQSQRSRKGQEELGQLFKDLGIKNRRENRRSPYSSAEKPEQEQQDEQNDNFDTSMEQQWDQQDKQNNQNKQRKSKKTRPGNHLPFAMICLRSGDVDQAILPIDGQHIPNVLKQVLQNGKISLSKLFQGEEVNKLQGQLRLISASNPIEKQAKIPTSIGVPLRVLVATPILAGVEGYVRAQQGSKVAFNIHPVVTATHLQTMEAWIAGCFMTGVKSVRAIEINQRLEGEVKFTTFENVPGIELDLKVPQQKQRLFGLHSTPVTYIRQVSTRTQQSKEPQVKTIYDEQLEQLQQDVNKVVGQQMGLPIRIRGHYHVPSSPADYKQLAQLLMATENQIHVSLEPQQQQDGQQDGQQVIRIRVGANVFQKVSGQDMQQHKPQLGEFYSGKTVKFDQAYPQDFQDMQLDDHSKRGASLKKFTDSFQPRQMYKHELKIQVQTTAGQQPLQCKLETAAVCDAKLKFCKLHLDIKRSAMFSQEEGQWELRSDAQIVTPQTVPSVSMLQQQQGKQQRFVCQANTKWGTQQGKQQHINVQIQGEQARKQEWTQQEDRQGQQNKYFKKRTAFLNKYDLVAEYQLSPQLQQRFTRGLETLKAYNFWNTEVELNSNRPQQHQQRDRQVHATLVIDPITQQTCNISIKTPQESIRIQPVQLPTPMRPFPLIRHTDKPVHSTRQFLSAIGVSQHQQRAECTVDGQRVQTFDNVAYKAPISNKCYSVLAKDCSGAEQPKFAVLMKAAGEQQRNAAQQDKKLKVMTPEAVIVCQPKQFQQSQQNQHAQKSQQSQQKQLECRVDDQQVQPDDDNEQVQFNNDEQTSVTITARGVQVTFNGRKAWIKISSIYKEAQCGLCGDYNDNGNGSNELRTAGGDNTDDLTSFHRSFSVRDNECSQQEQNDFYGQQATKARFSISSSEFQQANADWPDRSSSSSEQQDSQENNNDDQEQQNNDDDQEQQDDSWWGPSKKSGKQQCKWGKCSSKSQQQKGQQQKGQQKKSRRQQTEEPVWKTIVKEYAHKICFSTEAVKQCPAGTQSIDSQQSTDSVYGSGEEQANQGGIQQDQQQRKNTKKVYFICQDRSSQDARRLLRQARRGVIVDTDGQEPSFNEPVYQPTKCVRY